MKLLICFILNICINAVLLQSLCSHKTCNECIRDENMCVWCAKEEFQESRCKPKFMLSSDWCLNETINPKNHVEYTEDQDFHSENDTVTQLRPQKADIYIRAGESVNFKFLFKSMQNYPVDLYFLFDASRTMEDLKSKTTPQIKNVYETIHSMTNNVRLGIGTFVDKNALPFTQVLNSVSVYSFQNRLSLTKDVKQFQTAFASIPFGANYDEQEGTLDALAQVLTCDEEIGWRTDSRKIVLVLTDSPFHAARDGSVAGIFKPYDGKCYLENDKYKNELVMDYPSIGIIRKLAAEKKITVVFAVDLANLPRYKNLNDYDKGLRIVSFEKDSVQKIVKDIYQKITRILNIKANMKPELTNLLKISFKPECQNPDNINCLVKQNTTKEIVGSVKLVKYYSSDDKITVNISIKGIREQLTLHINVIKDCNCTNGLETNSSTSCSSKGVKRCGICECDNGWSGVKCECSDSKLPENYDKLYCTAPNTTNVCNNQPWLCKCGLCACSEGLEGNYCECGPKSCKKKCRDNEYCNCGTCTCKEGWKGDDCSCTQSKKECMEEGVICYNRGTCECGNCKCYDIPKWDVRGKQNDKCLVLPDENPEASHSRQCVTLEYCVLCHLNEATCSQCDKNIHVGKVNNLTADHFQEFPNKCQLRAKVGCYTKFLYRYNDGILYNIEVLLQTELNCAENYYVSGIVCAVVLIIIGIATLLVWKYMVDKRDREECEKLQKDIQAHEDQYCDNVVYVPATRTTINPTYEALLRDRD